jgi:hypothetical protein
MIANLAKSKNSKKINNHQSQYHGITKKSFKKSYGWKKDIFGILCKFKKWEKKMGKKTPKSQNHIFLIKNA